MQIEPVERVVERIVAASEQARDGVVAVDADGTLWTGDVGDDAMWGLVQRGHVLPSAHAALLREVETFGGRSDVASEKGPYGLLVALHERMVQGVYSEELFCALNAWMAAGRSFAQARAIAAEIAVTTRIESRVHAEMRQLLSLVRGRGIEVFVVSASPRFIVEPTAALLGFDAAHVVAAEVAEALGVLQPQAITPIPYGEGKVTRLREQIGGRPLLAAFGDNVFDVPMLEASHVPVAVRPKSRLRDVAHRTPRLVELQSP